MPNFNGREGEDPKHYFIKIRAFLEAHYLESDEDKIKVFLSSLSGQALELYLTVDLDKQGDVNYLDNIFRRHFQPSKHWIIGMSQFLKMKMEINESMSNFVFRVKKMANEYGFGEELIKAVFIQGLPLKFLKHIAVKGVSELDDIVKVSLDFEKILELDEALTIPAVNLVQQESEKVGDSIRRNINILSKQSHRESKVSVFHDKLVVNRLKDSRACYFCGRLGHIKAKCHSYRRSKLSCGDSMNNGYRDCVNNRSRKNCGGYGNANISYHKGSYLGGVSGNLKENRSKNRIFNRYRNKSGSSFNNKSRYANYDTDWRRNNGTENERNYLKRDARNNINGCSAETREKSMPDMSTKKKSVNVEMVGKIHKNKGSQEVNKIGKEEKDHNDKIQEELGEDEINQQKSLKFGVTKSKEVIDSLVVERNKENNVNKNRVGCSERLGHKLSSMSGPDNKVSGRTFTLEVKKKGVGSVHKALLGLVVLCLYCLLCVLKGVISQGKGFYGTINLRQDYLNYLYT